jgi:predicted extracellular nuclease
MNLRTLLPVVVGAAAALALPAAAPAASTTLVINEIDYDQPGTDTAEFLELANVSSGSIDLDPHSVQLVNGSGASVYQTIELPDVDLAAGDHYVICANATTTPNCDLDVAPDTNLLQNGDPDAIALRRGSTLVDTVSYEGNTAAPYTEGSGAGLLDAGGTPPAGLSRCQDGTDSDINAADFQLRPITPGAENDCPPPIPFGACGDDGETAIHGIQGAGTASAAAGEQRVIEGVVVGDFAGAGGLGGYFVQEEDADADADPATSEGIFVAGGDVADVGDVVRVRGTVSESFGRTQLGSITAAEVCPGEGAVTATEVQLPVTSLGDWERLESMAVTLPQELTISEYFDFDRFNETVLSLGRQMTPTAVHEPGSPEAEALLEVNLESRIMLDDGRNTENPDPALHPDGDVFTLDHRFRGGDLISGVTGVLDFAFGDYRVQPTAHAEYTEVNDRPAAHEDVGGNVEVASFNVLNYFTTLTGPDARGANTPQEFERQRAKIISAITAIDADVVGLIEIENNEEALADLVEGLNDATEPGRYAAIETGVIGTDVIKVAFAYQPARVTPVGEHAILDSGVDPRFLDDFNRPALAQTFRDNETGGVFTTVVNHLKSKGSDCNAVGDPDTGDGAGNCNLTRTAAAEALVDWLADDPTGSGDDDFLIIGDLNSYDKEDPIDALLAGGYTDLIREFQGENAYSYVFDGMIGYLDHGLAGEGLADEVTGATVWHINADEPDILDYDQTFKRPAQEALYEPDAYRSSDHDPVIVGLDACDEIAPEIEVSVTPDSLWPPNHKYRTVQATVTASDNFDEEPEVRVLSATSNEPDDAPGGGDGNTTNDIVVVDEDTFQVRAERDENRSGRVYTITYEVTDSCGNSSTASATVGVPVRR